MHILFIVKNILNHKLQKCVKIIDNEMKYKNIISDTEI